MSRLKSVNEYNHDVENTIEVEQPAPDKIETKIVPLHCYNCPAQLYDDLVTPRTNDANGVLMQPVICLSCGYRDLRIAD